MVSEILARIEEATGGSSCIYRGENKCYDKVSSGLYRFYEKKKPKWKHMSEKQKERVLKEAEKEPILRERFYEVQHLGGKTNWIDFTDDPLVALLFACEGEWREDGRIIVAKKEDLREKTYRAPCGQDVYPQQSSVLVRPQSGGVIDIANIRQVCVPRNKKGDLQWALAEKHGTYHRLLFNDIHGNIRFQSGRLLQAFDKKVVVEGMGITRIFVTDDKQKRHEVDFMKNMKPLETVGKPALKGSDPNKLFIDGNVRITGKMHLTEKENCARAILCQAHKESKDVRIDVITDYKGRYMSKEKRYRGRVTDFSAHEVKFFFREMGAVTRIR